MNPFDLSAAAWRQSSIDEASFIESLAARLSLALPGMVVVCRNFAFFKKNRKVTSIEVRFKDNNFFLQYSRSHGLIAEVGHVSRNICLSREEVSFSDWLKLLSDAINQYAEVNENRRQALEKFLMG
jgi:hypothetical protein